MRTKLRQAPPQGGYFEGEFGISKTLCQKLLAKALSRGGDFADLYFEHTRNSYLGLEDGKVNQSYTEIELGVGIRTVLGDQTGYGFTQDLSLASMLSAAATAASIAGQRAAIPTSAFKKLTAGNYYPNDPHEIEMQLPSKIAVVQRLNELCFAKSPRITKVSALFSHTVKRIMVVTSDGTVAEDTIPNSFLYATVVAEKDGRREQASWHLGGKRAFSYYTPAVVEECATKAVEHALIKFDAIQPPAGEVPVVLGPGLTGVLLHEAIGHGMEADFNRKKISTFCDRLGTRVAPSFVTIVDDGTNPGVAGSVNFDDEGTPGQRTVLVENGILKGFLHDRVSARHYKVKPTGNGRRESFQHHPIPRMRNTCMLAGKASPEDAIKQAKNGIYVEDVANGQVKIGEGDFAFYVSQGRRIENGKLTAPIKDVNIIGNGPKMLANIQLLANDFQMFGGGAGRCGKDGQGVPVSFGMPTCLVKSLTVGGTRAEGGRK
jgi:TldD protein